jgi:hypothetical protein
MATYEFELAPPPAHPGRRLLWLTHGAGFILFEDVRRRAIEQIDAKLDGRARAAALKAIDDAVYGLMQVADGVSGALRGDELCLSVKVSARLTRGKEVVDELDLFESDGTCMGYHYWLQGDFGEDPVASRR